MKQLRENVTYLDELRDALRSYRLPEKLERVFNELLVATWNTALGQNLKSCDMKKAAAYKGAVVLCRQALSNIETELLNGRRREGSTVQGTDGAGNANAGADGGATGNEGLPDQDGAGPPDGRGQHSEHLADADD